jgi:hypothetical protein
MFRSPAIVAVLAFCLIPMQARAIIVMGDVTNPNDTSQLLAPDPYNLSSYVGSLAGLPGTTISPTYFVTVTHGGTPSTTFTYNNGTSTPTNYTVRQVATLNDLALWQIDPASGQSFSYYAPVYMNSTIVGQPLITIGPGRAKGTPIISNSPLYGLQGAPGVPNGLQGWQWGAGGPGLTWGTNKVGSVVDLTSSGFPGNYLYFPFNYNPNNASEAIYAQLDSGGPTFVLDPATNTYELAGLNSLVDTVLDASGNTVFGAIFDARGFYYRDGNGNLVEITGNSPVPLGSYAVDIQSDIDWLLQEGVPLNVPEPSSLLLTGLVAAGMALRYWRRSACPTGPSLKKDVK